MDRRDTIKSLLVGTVIGGVAIGTQSCRKDPLEIVDKKINKPKYGRTPSEQLYDQSIEDSPTFFSEADLGTIAILCDIILPSQGEHGSATDAEVPAFIEFMAKDLPEHQLPLQGGIMWLNGESRRRFEVPFVQASVAQQINIVDDIAYPDPDKKSPQFEPGRSFFTRMRNLTMTGYFTTRMGIKALGYVGNRPNMWDGVPQDVLDKHGLAYDEKWMPKFVNHETRDQVAKWDENGNLLNN